MTELTRRASVLIADDSTSIRSYVSELLAGAGYGVEEVENGSACLARIEAPPPPEVVLLDVEMPGMSGVEVLQAIGLKPRLFSIILFTTQSSLEQIAAGLDLGADDYVIKPFREVDLLARIRAAVRNTRHKRALAKARQETEEALSRLQRTQGKLVEQEKITAVARLAAGAAHHINNPLGFLMSNLSTLDRYTGALLRYADDLARELRVLEPERETAIDDLQRTHRIRQIRKDLPDLLQETRDGGQRIALIVQQLAQLELGLSNHAMTELDLVLLLQPLVDMLVVLAPPGTKVAWSQPEHGIAIQGSLTLLNTALIALLKNACEALGEHPGSISVSVSCRPELAEIVISDSGAGISEQHLHSLFDPFFTTKTPDSHVGLGLTIAERFISGHGGRIAISSDLAGTCVKVEIPRLPVPQADDSTPSLPLP
ncbi:MAG: histidine kinase [Geobacteraceae bacterium GWC2_58_44]|nr:MAG: histidine kinase [Geobacteraceae bacterium GWC2_58_44]